MWCPRCGKPVQRAERIGDVPDCAGACRAEHRGEWEAARHGHILRELQTLIRPDATRALPAAPAPRRGLSWAPMRAWR